jgi:hypothetical protein
MSRISITQFESVWDDLAFVTDIIKRLFDRLSDLTFIMTLAEMGNGFTSALRDSSRPSYRKLIRILAAVSTVPLLALALTSMGMMAHLFKVASSIDIVYQGSGGVSDETERKAAEIKKGQLTLERLHLAYPCICIVIAIGLVVQASIVKHRYQKRGSDQVSLLPSILSRMSNLSDRLAQNRQNSSLYLAAACLWTLNCIWDIVRADLDNEVVVLIDIAGELILGVLPLFVALVLLFIVVIRKKDGLWTSMQPWTMKEDGSPKIDIPSDEMVSTSNRDEGGSPAELFSAHSPRSREKPPVVEADTSSPRVLLEMPTTQTVPVELNAHTGPVELDSTEKRTELVG